jgi:hypothetical protein
MRFLIAILMLMAAIAAAANIPKQIRNADRRGGHRMVDLSAIAARPAFGLVRWPDRRRSSGRSTLNGSRRGGLVLGL